jgi:glycine/D-amino acid oxidase-like deaminating enzyme
MPESTSPWLAQYHRSRPLRRLHGRADADVCVIGGGIAGVSTVWQGLLRTDASFALLEAGKVGHGASGHNAGQAVDGFERPLASMAAEFGAGAVAALQAEVSAAWPTLEEACAYAGVELVHVTGRTVITQRWHLRRLLEDELIARTGDRIIVAEDSPLLDAESRRYVSLVPRSELDGMGIANPGACEGAAFSRRGCVNSSMLAEMMVERLLSDHGDRFQAYEETTALSLGLEKDVAVRTDAGDLTCGRAVLCTNGYEASPMHGAVSMRFAPITGRAACMLAYFDSDQRGPEVLTYLPEKEGYYFYLTRRPARDDELVCVGGPERDLGPAERFERRADLVPGGLEEIRRFLRSSVPGYVHREDHPFFWSGLMGYTPSGIRLAGPWPGDRRLLLNVGCNGVGIVPSMAAAKRIAAHLSGDDAGPSLFEPARQWA